MSARVVIVGRPNVGKSTLFNRLTGRKRALVHDRPGVTRDTREGEAELQDLAFTLVDTAGLEEAAPETLAARMRAQTESAMRGADVILFVFDSRQGLTPLDHTFADLVRRTNIPCLLVANKCEGRIGEQGRHEAYALGLGEPLPFSAEHGLGESDLRDALAPFVLRVHASADDDSDDFVDGDSFDDEEDGQVLKPQRPLRVAILGRPNAGKSTLMNRLLGFERVLTGPEAGITRDAISARVQLGDLTVELVDTAGLRRKARIDDPVEKLATADTLNTLRFADVVLVLMDAQHPFEEQDTRIADLAVREGRATLLLMNKWDTIEDRSQKMTEWRYEADRYLAQAKDIPILAVSASTGEGLHKLGDAIIKINALWNRRVSTAKLNDWLGFTLQEHAPPAVHGKRLKLRYMTQTKTRPPTFVLFGSRTDELPDSYVRYLINKLRQDFRLPGVPIRILLRSGDNPYASKVKKR